ncbi:MAG TPA: ribonuclease III [Microbacteriaceae bacterium]|nr:ribonuclease III [Microbacteriaceae bacterium]
MQHLLQVQLSDELCQHALTHRSFAYEHGGLPTNERLEFLGDSVLGLAVTATLYRSFPDLEEGELAKRRAAIVSTVSLAGIARDLGLGPFIRLGRGETQSGGADKDSILADTVEALIGATYLECGLEIAEGLVLRLVGDAINASNLAGPGVDPKTSLQELAAARLAGPPHYSVEATGPDHNRVYSARVEVAGVVGAGEGSSKKHAEMAAARDAWTQLTANA